MPDITPAPDPNSYVEPAPYVESTPYAAPSTEVPTERVGRGLALSLVAIPAAMLLTAVIWRLGFIASLSAFVLAGLAVILYRRGSGGPVKRGIPALIAVILVGSVACFFSAVLTDLVQYYGRQSPADQSGLGTMGEFVRANVFYGPVLSSYGKDAILFGLFAVLGIFGTLRTLLRSSRSA